MSSKGAGEEVKGSAGVAATRSVMVYEPSEPVEFNTGWRWQRTLLEHRVRERDDRDVLLLLEHSPTVYTLGRKATLDNVAFDVESPPAGVQVERLERGGEVTCHCPGQIVGYPILDLNHFKRDLHWYVRQIEAVILHTLDAFGLEGERDPGLTGVWVQGTKVAAIGIYVSRWITMHGFALNVDADLAPFERIVPCGIADKPVSSLHQFIPGVKRAEVVAQLERSFEHVFGARLERAQEAEFQDMLERPPLPGKGKR